MEARYHLLCFAAEDSDTPAAREHAPALVRHLLWPRARTALGQAALLTFVLALNNFAVPTILQVKVFPAELWVRFSADMEMCPQHHVKLEWVE